MTEFAGVLEEGFVCIDVTEQGRRWAEAADLAAREVSADPEARARHMRYRETWFVGVDALPTDANGAVAGVALEPRWTEGMYQPAAWHPAQLSILYPGYPLRDPGQSEANHRYRVKRDAAHVDGLLPVGEARRRFPGEFHAFVLGLPLNVAAGGPTVCWRGSHKIMGRALRAAIGTRDPREVDVTEAYQAARREVFDTCERVALRAAPGGAYLLHRFTLHGSAPWGDAPGPERRVAFFRPEMDDPYAWLSAP